MADSNTAEFDVRLNEWKHKFEAEQEAFIALCKAARNCPDNKIAQNILTSTQALSLTLRGII